MHERSTADPTTSGMGTTMTVALLEGGTVTFGHVGDSRAYLVRGGRIEQLTNDHSLVNELLRSGRLSPEEAVTHPQRSVITRAVGTDPDVDVDSFTVDGREGDVFLICSDGLTDMIGDETILELVERHSDDLDRATKSLVAAANRGGGEDNVTVVAFSLTDVHLEDTVQMPAAGGGSEEDTLDGVPAPTLESVLPPADPASDSPAPPPKAPIPRAARARLAVTMIVLLGVAAVLLVWGLLR